MTRAQHRKTNAYRAGGRAGIDALADRLIEGAPDPVATVIDGIRHELKASDDWRYEQKEGMV
ncbi:hypothetical protein JF540_22845 [Salipiger thiooxidans]|uniref:hypothetical protein n=1 Tax=Salipiger thiooxidans TaxID=282683 RepID=UPI001A8FBBEF|nr:hypothetical protein [Salipiger thiooxidans]MBN8189528.1 hypothetical protein [Salipiger thiooxidans]